MNGSVDLRSLTCLCGVALVFHRDARNAQLSCAEARDRQWMFGDTPPVAAVDPETMWDCGQKRMAKATLR